MHVKGLKCQMSAVPDSKMPGFPVFSAKFQTCKFVFQTRLSDSSKVSSKFWPSS